MKPVLLLFVGLLLPGCARKPAPVAADSTTIRTSVGMGGSLVVPRFVGNWNRPAADRPGQSESLVMERGGGLRFVNLCARQGVSWAEVPGDSLALTSTAGGTSAPVERRFHLQRFTDSLLVLEGDGLEAGSWTRSAAPAENSCPTP